MCVILNIILCGYAYKKKLFLEYQLKIHYQSDKIIDIYFTLSKWGQITRKLLLFRNLLARLIVVEPFHFLALYFNDKHSGHLEISFPSAGDLTIPDIRFRKVMKFARQRQLNSDWSYHLILLINGRNFVSLCVLGTLFISTQLFWRRKVSMINSCFIQRALRSELRCITHAKEKSLARAPGEEGERYCHRAGSSTFITLRIRDSVRRTLTAGLVREMSRDILDDT